MASPLQQSSTRRKLAYFGLILAIYVANTFVVRGVASPLTGGVAPARSLTAQANALELREESQGDADLVGSTLRLGLTGSRGLAVTLLWQAAIDRQTKHEWNKLEILVRSLTKLQPHFLTPWLFQSWNLAYNVSVESDRPKDKYFYISRGIELLARGERVNRDNPDMRFWLGFYYQNKFGVSDEANTLRSLLQLSGIDPAKRDPGTIQQGDGSGQKKLIRDVPADLARFEQFCKENPQLLRRLREALKFKTPDDIVEFLADNRKVPTRYVDLKMDSGPFRGNAGELKPADEQFPILPTAKSRLFPNEPTAASTLGDSFDNYQFARAWFSYSLDPLPEAEIMTTIKSRDERLKEPANRGRKLPRSPAEVIFRQSPARAQSFVAERLEKEGWFDQTGWVVDRGQVGNSRWFATDIAIGAGDPWAANAWKDAYELWRKHGLANGIIIEPPTEIQRLTQLARRFVEKFNIIPGDNGEGYRPEALDPEMARCLLAYRQLFFRQQNQSMTNMMHHYNRAFTEQDPNAIQARKLIFDAERIRVVENDPWRATQDYQKAFELWKTVLGNPQYAEFRNDAFILEELYEAQCKYVDLLRKYDPPPPPPAMRPAYISADVLRLGAASATGAAFPGATGFGIAYGVVTDQKALPLPIVGPLDGNDPSGRPWIPSEIVAEVRAKLYPDESRPPVAVPPVTVTPGTSPTPRSREAPK